MATQQPMAPVAEPAGMTDDQVGASPRTACNNQSERQPWAYQAQSYSTPVTSGNKDWAIP
jgi:hypothetical protein